MSEKELKPKSFRIDDVTAEKFKQISSELGGNQQEALSKLIEAFEFQKGKATLTNKKEDIDTFEKYVTLVTRMYMTSLEDNQNVTATVRAEFEALLLSKESTIQDLQSRESLAKELKEAATTKAKSLTEENLNLYKKISELDNKLETNKATFENTLLDKNNLNKTLTDLCTDLKEKVKEMTLEHLEFKDKSKLLETTINERESLIKENSDYQDKLSLQIQRVKDGAEQHQKREIELLENTKQKAEITQQKAINEQEKKYQDQIQSLKEVKQKEIDKYQQKYFELLESKNIYKEVNTEK